MIRHQVFAGLREQALLSRTCPLCHLLFAGREPEIGCGTAHIVDVALEIRLLCQKPRLRQNGFMASDLDDPPLVEGQGTEAAAAKAAPVADETELHLADGRDASQSLVGRMGRPHIRKGVHIIHFQGGKGLCRGILDHKKVIRIRLTKTLSGKRIRVLVLGEKALRIGTLVFPHLVVGRQPNRIINILPPVCLINGPVNKGKILNVDSRGQGVGNLYDGPFSHTIGNEICLGIHQDGMLHFSGPVIVVSQTAQAGLDPADDNRGLLIDRPDQVAVDHRGVIGPLSHDAAGRIGILFPSSFGHGIVVHHGIHISGRHKKPQPGLTQDCDALLFFPVRLGSPPGIHGPPGAGL